MKYPQSGELKLAKQRKSDYLVFFVHFFEGNKRAISRHVQLVNELGFDAFVFNLNDEIKSLKDIPISPTGQFGLKHVLADQIETLMNLLPQKKIVFSFSNPSASAIEAIRRRNCSDVVGMICDSGPSAAFAKSAYNLFVKEKQDHNWLIRMALLPLKTLSWSPKLHKDIHADLDSFPEGFPILSIRGWKDALIAPEDIDQVFQPHHNLDWQKLSLPDAEHLTGLRDFEDLYKPAVERFLKKFVND